MSLIGKTVNFRHGTMKGQGVVARRVYRVFGSLEPMQDYVIICGGRRCEVNEIDIVEIVEPHGA